MNSTRTRQGLAAILFVLTLGTAGCSNADRSAVNDDQQAEDIAGAEGHKVTRISGYPLDRSLDGLIGMQDVDTIVVVKATKFLDPQFIGAVGPDGGDSTKEFIVTPLDARVDSIYRGSAKVKDAVRLIIGGGKIGDVEVVAAPELAAQPKDIAQYSRLLVAGKTITLDGLGTVLDPYFVYGINGEGRVKTLMESAGGGDVSFSLAQLQARLP